VRFKRWRTSGLPCVCERARVAALRFVFWRPPGEDAPGCWGKSLHRLIDASYLDGYFALGAGIPVGGNLDWQLVDLSLGLELGLPDLPELTLMVGVGVSLVHYLLLCLVALALSGSLGHGD